MFDLCKYKYIFGKPGMGIHSYRIFNIAIVDVLSTILGSYIISLLTNYKFIYVPIFMFILGIILHKIFCVKTTVNNLIFQA